MEIVFEVGPIAPRDPLPFARADKAGAWVVCAKIVCGARLVKMPGSGGLWANQVRLGPGWMLDNERFLFRMGKHTIKRLRRGLRPKLRRPGDMTGLWAEDEEGYRVGRLYDREYTHAQYERIDLPITIECHRCGLVQEINVEHLTSRQPK